MFPFGKKEDLCGLESSRELNRFFYVGDSDGLWRRLSEVELAALPTKQRHDYRKFNLPEGDWFLQLVKPGYHTKLDFTQAGLQEPRPDQLPALLFAGKDGKFEALYNVKDAGGARGFIAARI